MSTSRARSDNPFDLAMAARSMLFEEMLYQQRDIFDPLAQRRQVNRDDAQAIEQVFAKGPGLDGFPQIAVAAGNDADVQLDAFLAAHLHEFPLLDHPQQLRLDVETQVGDFIEKEGPMIGQFKQTVLGLKGTGERAFDVAEQLAFQQALHQGRTIHRDKGLIGSQAVAVNGTRHQFLAGTAFAGDEHRAVARCRAPDLGKHLLHGRTAANDGSDRRIPR